MCRWCRSELFNPATAVLDDLPLAAQERAKASPHPVFPLNQKKTTPKRKAPARSRAKSKKTSTLEKVTEVRTGYARLALMLVLANLFLTGYVISKISTIESDTQAEIDKQEETVTTSSESDGGDI